MAFYLPGFYGDIIPFTLFVIASFTDFLDGLLARLYKEESKLGELLDPIADKIIVADNNSTDDSSKLLKKYEKLYRAKVYTILQLRLHPAIVELKQKLSLMPQQEPLEIELTYLTSRGKWYDKSWKGNLAKSGGVAANIGIHFFDMLLCYFFCYLL